METPQRILMGCAVALAAAAVAHADAKSDPVVQKARQATARVKSLQSDLAVTFKRGAETQSMTGTVLLMRPNYGIVTIKTPEGTQEIRSTGKESFVVVPGQKEYMKRAADPTGRSLFPLPGSPVAAFLQPSEIGAQGTHRLTGTTKVDGKTYQVVEVTAPEPPTRRKLFVGPSGLVEGVELSQPGDPESPVVAIWLKNVKLNVPVTAQRFAYTPPAGFSVPKGPESNLLPVGAKAPDFLLPQPGGGQLSLEEALKGKKAVLLNFWFYS